MKDKKLKKIVYVVNHLKYHGGIEKLVSNKIDAWIDVYGYEVTVITINQNGAPLIYQPKNDFELIDLRLEKVNSHSFLDILKFCKKLKHIFNRINPDLVIATITGIPSLILPLLSRKTKKVLEIHSSGALSVTKSWKNKWRFLKRYHKVVLLNEDEKKYYELNNLAVIPNFVPIYENDMMPLFMNRERVIIAAGRIHPDKQYDHMVKIWELVFKKFPKWTLEIFGNGDEEIANSLNKYIENQSLERISINNAVDDLEEKLKTSSIFILTSDTECFPMVLVECKNAGLPAISYDSPNGPRHIISNDGVLVEHNNIEEFTNVLSALLNDEKKRFLLSENAFKNRVQFSANTIIKEWNKLL